VLGEKPEGSDLWLIATLATVAGHNYISELKLGNSVNSCRP